MNFDSLAKKTILQISDDIEKSDKNYILDLEYEEGVLTITAPKGQYILNKNSQLQEIWLSSPISGAHHFKLQLETKQWLSKKDADMLKLLQNELFDISNINIEWSVN